MSNKNNIKEKIVDLIINSLDEKIIPWEKPWVGAINAISKKEYSGKNAFFLGIVANINNYSDNRWATFNQATKEGWKIKKGSKATPIFYVNLYDKKTKKDFDKESIIHLSLEEQRKYLEENVYRNLKTFYVFNASQIEDMPELQKTNYKNTIFNEKLVMEFVSILSKNINLEIKEGNEAYYSPKENYISIPNINTFKNKEYYYGTLFHEIAHATSHSTRLNREISTIFGDEKYAKEELIAEFTNLLLSNNLEISKKRTFDNSKSYCQDWSKILKKNKDLLFEALDEALKVYQYLEKEGDLKVLEEKYENVISKKKNPSLKDLKKEVSIIEYGERVLGFTFLKKNRENYYIAEHDSCIVNAVQNDFFRYSRNVGGSIVDFIMHFEKLDLKETVAKLKDYYENYGATSLKFESSTKRNLEKIGIELPKKDIDNKNVIAYLTKTRNISKAIVEDLIEKELLYQDTKKNCVFVGKIENIAYNAVRRSTFKNSNFKADAENSFKEVGFYLDNKADKLVIVESAIDALSFQDLHKEKSNYLSVNGVSNAEGAIRLHLVKRLEENKDLKEITIAFDNDTAGRNATNKLVSFLKEHYPHYQINFIFPNEKDWNDELLKEKEKSKDLEM